MPAEKRAARIMAWAFVLGALVGLAIFVDVAFWSGGAWGNRGRMSGSQTA